VDGIVRLLFSEEHEPVNIGNPVETSVLEFARLINEYTGNQAGIIYHENLRTEGDPQRRRPDITQARQKLGWEPTLSLEEGIRKTIPYFEKQLALT
jgi:dTDP-glucose 4,6-dehydratase